MTPVSNEWVLGVTQPLPADRSTEIAPSVEPAVRGGRAWTVLLAGFVAGYLVLQITATGLQSLRGEAGLIVAASVIACLVLVERAFFGSPLSQTAARLGLGPLQPGGLLRAALVSAALVACLPLAALAGGVDLRPRDDWFWLIPGLFAQNGVAEEVLFRGYLFRHLRDGRGFWRAAGLSMLPFAGVHAWLLLSLSLPLAVTSIGVAVATAFPLANLFDRGGRTIWAPALLHVATHAIKLVEIPEAGALPVSLTWLAACIVVPYLVFALGRRSPG